MLCFPSPPGAGFRAVALAALPRLSLFSRPSAPSVGAEADAPAATAPVPLLLGVASNGISSWLAGTSKLWRTAAVRRDVSASGPTGGLPIGDGATGNLVAAEPPPLILWGLRSLLMRLAGAGLLSRVRSISASRRSCSAFCLLLSVVLMLVPRPRPRVGSSGTRRCA